MVKPKVRISRNFNKRGNRSAKWLLPAISMLTFIASWAGVFPQNLVERWYARGTFPIISRTAEKIADAVSFSWLDVALPLGLLLIVWLAYRHHWRILLNVIAVAYLIFFWSWGVNYHREPLASKLPVDSGNTKPAAMEIFTRHAAEEINRLYPEKQKLAYDEQATRQEAGLRVEHVVKVIDGSDWVAPHQIKVSRLINPWFRAAGIDGMFNPAGQEPLISSTVLDIERPFVIAHELAHVRGYPDEGDANVIAALATLLDGSPAFQYSGWLALWLYLRNREMDMLLDAGPRADLQRTFNRSRSEQIQWISRAQTLMLDWFLKSNHVEQGVRSYSRVVLLAAGTEPYWDQFR